MTANGVVAARELVVLRLEDDDGTLGLRRGRPVRALRRRADRAMRWRRSARGRRRGAPAAGPRGRGARRLDLEAPPRRARPLGEPGNDALPVNMTLPAGPPEEVAARARPRAARGLRLLQGQGRPARRRGARGRRARRGRARGPRFGWTPTAPGRWTRRSHAIARARGATTSSSWSSRARRSRSWPRCASACPCRSPPTSRSTTPERRRGARSRSAPATSVNVKLAAERRLRGRARGAARGPRARPRAVPVQHARRPLGHRGGAPAGGGRGAARWPAGWPRSSLFDARWRRRCRRPDGLLAVPQGPGLGVEVDEDALAEVLVDEIV